MYNLIIGSADGSILADRMLESTEPHLRFDPAALQGLPTLLAPELNTGWMTDPPPQIARFGRVQEVRKVGSTWRFTFVPNAVPPVPLQVIRDLAESLDINTNGFGDLGHTAWNVKRPDLYEVLLEQAAPPDGLVARPEVGRIAMMMPFNPAFDRVWETVKALADERGWVCDRANTVWEHDRIMDDVLELITRAQIIVCDLSGHNPNVMYEVGLAHGLSQQIVPIAQSGADALPFDLSAHRTISYLNNGEGMVKLRAEIAPRLDTLMQRASKRR